MAKDIRINNPSDLLVKMLEDYKTSESAKSLGAAASALIAIGFYHWSSEQVDKAFIGGSGEAEKALWEEYHKSGTDKDFLTWLISEAIPNQWGGNRK